MTDENDSNESTDANASEENTENVSSTDLSDVFEDLDDESTDKEDKSDDDKGETEDEAEGKTDDKSEDTESPSDKDTSVSLEAIQNENTGLQKTVLAERHRRQEAESKLKEYDSKDTPDPLEDPEGYAKHLASESTQAAWESTSKTSRIIWNKMHDDYGEMEKVFLDMIGFDPETKSATKNHHLAQEMRQSEDPSGFVYNKAKEHLEVKNLRDPAYIQKIKDEAFALGLKESKEKEDKPVPATDLPDLDKAAASALNTEPVEKEESWGDVFKD